MFRNSIFRAVAAATFLGAALLSPSQALAHHSFAMFDRTKHITIVGTIKEFQWANPHTWIQVMVADKKGKLVEWSLEGGSPNLLGRNGWKRTSLKPGDKVTIDIYPLKNGKPGGSFIEIKKPDGTRLTYHG